MKKINFTVGLFFMCLSLFATETNMGKKENSNRLAGNLEYACCTRSATVTISDGRGNENSATRTEEVCVNNGESVAATMPTACNVAQNEPNKKALESLSLMTP